MKHITLAALLLGLATAAQAQTARTAPRPPVEVQVSGGRITVSDTGIRLAPDQVAVAWVLVTPGYRFNPGSIDFGELQGYFRCATFNNALGIRCTKSGDVPSGQLRYAISVVAEPGSVAAEVMNPVLWIQNE